jgi:hypothetical protein
MSEQAVNTMDAVQPESAKLDASAVTKPITDAGRQVYDMVAKDVQWYKEKWEDIVHEVKAERTKAYTQEGLGVEDILQSLTEAKVASYIPGRVRLRMKTLKRQDQLTAQLAQALASTPGVNQAVVSQYTGSILMFFDTTQYASLEALLEAMKSQPVEPQSPEPGSADSK